MFIVFLSIKERDVQRCQNYSKFTYSNVWPTDRRFQILIGLSPESGDGRAFVYVIRRKNFNNALPLCSLKWQLSTKPCATWITARRVCDDKQVCNVLLVRKTTLIVAHLLWLYFSCAVKVNYWLGYSQILTAASNGRRICLLCNAVWIKRPRCTLNRRCKANVGPTLQPNPL